MTTGKIRYTLCVRSHATGQTRLHGVYNETGTADRIAASWRRVFAKRDLDVSVEVAVIYPSTAAWRDKYNPQADA